MHSEQTPFIYSLADACQSVSDIALKGLLEQSALQLSDKIKLPYHFVFLLLAIEDKRFLLHRGVDPVAVLRAILSNVAGRGSLQGASTITQQLYGVLRERGGKRRLHNGFYKVQQTQWAMLREVRSSKPAILSDYVRNVYWGKAYYGISAASDGYFGTRESCLTVAQSFFLIDRLATPNIMFPDRVIESLTRPLVWALLIENKFCVDELVDLYEANFQQGEDLWRFREKLSRK